MKVTIEFNLPEQSEEYDMAFNGHKYAYCFSQLDEYLRKLSKYEDKETIDIHELRAKMHEIKMDVFS